VPLSLVVQTSATVNPGESGRANPIVVRVYQLKSDVAFRAAPYEKLFDDDKATLGQELIESTSVTLRPNDQAALSLMVSGEAKFLGIAAFYRQYDNIQWKVPIPTPIKGSGIVLVDKSVSFTAK
jgi:type VI secretion system protein VasD